MIIDTIENLELYHPFDDKKIRRIQEFLSHTAKTGPKEGRTDLCGEDLYALVQIYDTRPKEESVMEAHREYLDMQYIIEGEEYFYIHDASKCIVKENQTPDRDFIFLECGEPAVKVKASAGMFVLLFPQDAHMPCIQTEKREKVKKVVFKIRRYNIF